MLKTRLVNALFILAIIAGLVVLFGWIVPTLTRLGSASPKIGNTPAVLQQVQTLSELVTVKYVMEKVILLEDVQWYGESRVLMVAHGISLAGIDLKEIKDGDIEISNKKVRIKLPPARVTATYLDDKQTKVVERTTGMLRAFDKDLEQNARQQAVMDINRAARDAGILKDAQERAQLQLRSLFLQMGYQEVEFRSP
jgi:Protein of unknown function (DUF4230)